jgi:hypothetical protein
VNWVTIIATVLATAAPSLISAVPPQYAGPIAGLIAGASALYHLYRASPNAPSRNTLRG